MAQPPMAGQYQRSSAEDGLLVFGICLIFLAAALFAAWYFFHEQISAAVSAVAHWQMALTGYFTDRYASLDAQVLARDPSGVKIGALWYLLHNVGDFFRIPAVAVMVALAAWCFLRNAPGQFTRNLDLPGLMRTQAETFRSAAPFVHRKLGLVQLSGAPPRLADPALHITEWLPLFACGKDGSYSEDRAKAELVNQLGPLWNGPPLADPHVRCLFAAFVLHAARRRADAIELLGDLAASLPNGKGEASSGPDAPLAFSPEAVAKADAILSHSDLGGRCITAAAQHAYTATAMMSVLTLAREQAGVLAPAQFAFLKLVDRRLWYALHSLGFPGSQNRAEQPNPRIEALGARDHWAAERDAGQPLPDPSLECALDLVRNRARKNAPGNNPSSENAA